MSGLATTPVRKPAPRPAKPVGRYWKGKAPKGAEQIPSDSDEEDEEAKEELEEQVEEEAIDEVEDEEASLPTRAAKPTTKSINVALKDVSISQDGRVIVGGREESGRTIMEEPDEEETSEEETKPGQKVESEESSEYESESEEEEEEKPKLQFRPVFVPKRARVTIAEREAIAEDTEEAQKRKEQEIEERRKQSHNMVADSIKRELAEKEKEDDIPDVDDTDGLDPEGEFEAWRLRELARIKRDKEEEMAREIEREEIERRRALPEEQRLKEDMERAKQTREEKPKGQQRFLQKYWHKGAFHQDDEVLKKHDYTEATESQMDVTLLPKVMQVRDFGKRSRTKYTHLVDQDTTIKAGGFGGTAHMKSGAKGIDAVGQQGCFNCGGPHLKKDCPNLMGPPERPGSGANGVPTGPRRDRDRDDGRRNWRNRDEAQGPSAPRRDDGERNRRGDDRRRAYDSYDGRDGDRDRYHAKRPRSRSRSPPAPRRRVRRSLSRSRSLSKERWRTDRDDHRRRRSRSPEDDRDDKRRRLD